MVYSLSSCPPYTLDVVSNAHLQMLISSICLHPNFYILSIFNFSWFFHFLFLLLSYLLLLFSHWFLFHALFLDCLSWELSRSGQPLFFLSFLLSWFFPNMLLALWMLYSLILLLATCNMFMQVFVSFGALSFKN